MNRLQFIVSENDAKLKAHYTAINFVGLCEQEVKDEKTIPTFYKGYGDSEFAGFDDANGLNIYHRLIDFSQVEDPDSGFSRKPMTSEEYSMVLIAYGNQRQIVDSNNNINYNVADEIRALFLKKLTTVQLANLDAQSGIITITGTQHNKQTVWAQELPDNEIKVTPDTLLFSIPYTISLQYIGDCKDLNCDLREILIDISKLSCDNINDPKFGLNAAKRLECGIDSNGMIFTFKVDNVLTDTRTIKIKQIGTYDLDAAVNINVDTLAFLKNGGAVSGTTEFEVGDTITVTITQDSAIIDSEVNIDTDF